MHGKLVCLQSSVLLVRREASSRTVSKSLLCYFLHLFLGAMHVRLVTHQSAGYYAEVIEVALRRLGKRRQLQVFRAACVACRISQYGSASAVPARASDATRSTLPVKRLGHN